jgi:hypothetical protein
MVSLFSSSSSMALSGKDVQFAVAFKTFPSNFCPKFWLIRSREGRLKRQEYLLYILNNVKSQSTPPRRLRILVQRCANPLSKFRFKQLTHPRCKSRPQRVTTPAPSERTQTRHHSATSSILSPPSADPLRVVDCLLWSCASASRPGVT